MAVLLNKNIDISKSILYDVWLVDFELTHAYIYWLKWHFKCRQIVTPT